MTTENTGKIEVETLPKTAQSFFAKRASQFVAVDFDAPKSNAHTAPTSTFDISYKISDAMNAFDQAHAALRDMPWLNDFKQAPSVVAAAQGIKESIELEKLQSVKDAMLNDLYEKRGQATDSGERERLDTLIRNLRSAKTYGALQAALAMTGAAMNAVTSENAMTPEEKRQIALNQFLAELKEFENEAEERKKKYHAAGFENPQLEQKIEASKQRLKTLEPDSPEYYKELNHNLDLQKEFDKSAAKFLHQKPGRENEALAAEADNAVSKADRMKQTAKDLQKLDKRREDLTNDFRGNQEDLSKVESHSFNEKKTTDNLISKKETNQDIKKTLTSPNNATQDGVAPLSELPQTSVENPPNIAGPKVSQTKTESDVDFLKGLAAETTSVAKKENLDVSHNDIVVPVLNNINKPVSTGRGC